MTTNIIHDIVVISTFAIIIVPDDVFTPITRVTTVMPTLAKLRLIAFVVKIALSNSLSEVILEKLWGR